MATRATKILQDKIKYGDFMNTGTPVQTNTPKNAIPGQIALGRGLYGSFLQNAANAGARTYAQGVLPTYGEFMAQRSAENAASDIVTGNVQPRTTYAGNTGGAAMPTTPAENLQGKTVRDMIAEQRNITYAQAAADRERATIDARTAYAQNRTTYGANAEALAEMGMQSSGYGDYLEGAAYAGQRADIQAARAGEIAAQREADRVYYADMMAQTEKETAAYLTLLDLAKGGEYTADEIRAAAEKQGITDAADLDALTKAAGTAKTEAEKANLPGNITADTTDKQIADMIAAGTLSPENEQAAKDARTEAAAQNVEAALAAKDWEGADKLVEQYYKSGAYSEDERQTYYLQKQLDIIDQGGKSESDVKAREQEIEKLKNEGKISAEDAEAAKKYLYANISTVVDGASVTYTPTRSTQNERDKTSFDLVINGEKVQTASHADTPVSREIKNILDSAAGENPTEGTVVLYDEGVYIYINSRGYNGWYKVSRDWTKEGVISSGKNKRIYEILKNDIAPTQASAVRPEHKQKAAVVGPASDKTTYAENMVVGPTK